MYLISIRRQDKDTSHQGKIYLFGNMPDIKKYYSTFFSTQDTIGIEKATRSVTLFVIKTFPWLPVTVTRIKMADFTANLTEPLGLEFRLCTVI